MEQFIVNEKMNDDDNRSGIPTKIRETNKQQKTFKRSVKPTPHCPTRKSEKYTTPTERKQRTSRKTCPMGTPWDMVVLVVVCRAALVDSVGVATA